VPCYQHLLEVHAPEEGGRVLRLGMLAVGNRA